MNSKSNLLLDVKSFLYKTGTLFCNPLCNTVCNITIFNLCSSIRLNLFLRTSLLGRTNMQQQWPRFKKSQKMLNFVNAVSRWNGTTTPLKGKKELMMTRTWCQWSRETPWCEMPKYAGVMLVKNAMMWLNIRYQECRGKVFAIMIPRYFLVCMAAHKENHCFMTFTLICNVVL